MLHYVNQLILVNVCGPTCCGVSSTSGTSRPRLGYGKQHTSRETEKEREID